MHLDVPRHNMDRQPREQRLADALKRCLEQDRYAAFFFRVDGDRLMLDTEVHDLPTGDVPEVVRMIQAEARHLIQKATR